MRQGKDMAKSPHGVHEESSDHRVLYKIVHIRKTAGARPEVAEPVLVYGHNVTVDLAAGRWKVLPDSKEIKQSDCHIEPCLAVLCNIGLDSPGKS